MARTACYSCLLLAGALQNDLAATITKHMCTEWLYWSIIEELVGLQLKRSRRCGTGTRILHGFVPHDGDAVRPGMQVTA